MKISGPFLILISILILVGGAPSGTAIEFSAEIAEPNSKEVAERQLTFKDGEQLIYYSPPQGWNCSLIGNTLHLRPTRADFAAAQIESVWLEKPVPFNASSIATMLEKAMITLPPQSQEATLVKREENPLPFNGNENLEITISYKLLGVGFQRSLLFVNTSSAQIVFKLTARQDDFEALHRAFRCSIATWRWLTNSPTQL